MSCELKEGKHEDSVRLLFVAFIFSCALPALHCGVVEVQSTHLARRLDRKSCIAKGHVRHASLFVLDGRCLAVGVNKCARRVAWESTC